MAQLWLLLHLASVIAWLGPTTAGYLLVRRLDRERREGRPLPRAQELWVWRRFETLLAIEHLSFACLVASGLVRLHAIGLSPVQVMSGGPLWLQVKLWVATLVLLPLEAHDVWLSHVALPRRLRELEEGRGEIEGALAPHRRYLATGVWVFAVLVPLYLSLVAWRPQ